MAHRMLENIRIVDMTSVMFGPYATLQLVDMGAEVIKVEPPTGDVFRMVGKSKKTKLMGPGHLAINRGKQSVVLDLKQEDDRAVMRNLIASADIFIHNVREKAATALGCGWDDVRALKPDIIYVHCAGFGHDGPYAGLQAYDDVIQAATGAVTLLTRVDGDERPRYLPTILVDKVSGLFAAQAMLAALVHKLRTGEGQHVEVPMFEAFTQFNLVEHLQAATYVPPMGPAGYMRQLDANRQPYRTADGWISIVTDNDAAFLTMFDLIGAPELASDPRFDDRIKRFKGMSAVYAEIGARMTGRTTAEWCEVLTRHRIPAMPVTDLDAVIDDPHLNAVGAVAVREHPTEGAFVEIRPPVRYSARPREELPFAPLLDEHGAAIREQYS